MDDDETFDWLVSFSGLRSVLVEYGGCVGLGYRSRLNTLVVGCGKSTLTEDMYDAGWKTIHAIDISHTVIEHMKARSSGLQKQGLRKGTGAEQHCQGQEGRAREGKGREGPVRARGAAS